MQRAANYETLRRLRLRQHRQRQRQRLSSSSCTWVVLSLSKCVVFINNSTATAAQGSSAGREGEERGVRSVANTKRMCAANSSSSRGRGTQCNNSCNLHSLSPFLFPSLLRIKHVATAQVRQRSAQIEVARSCSQAALTVVVVSACCCCLLLLLLSLLLVAVVVLGLLRHLRL